MGDQKSGQISGKKPSAHHVTPFSVYVKVWGSLIALTVITVSSSYFDFGGNYNVIIALVIATIKALLVTMFFMGLKYDSAENNVTFYVTILFFAVFPFLTISDLLFRVPAQAAKVDTDSVVASGEKVDVKALIKPAPESIAKGKGIFGQQCATCHGAEGKGDGPAAAAFNPKPRNFTSLENWKNPRTVAGVFKTLKEGLPGTPMPGFSTIPVEDRFAIVHYLRSLMPDRPEDTAQDVAALETLAGGGAGTGKISKLPIEFIIERMAEPEPKSNN